VRSGTGPTNEYPPNLPPPTLTMMMAANPPSPLGHSQRANRAAFMPPSPRDPVCFLSILAEASMERLGTEPPKKSARWPTPLECTEVMSPATDATASAALPRCPSRRSCDGDTSSRASSPAVPGRLYLCRKCNREYASTDAVRKHARQNHGDWLKEQGTGATSLYCIVVDPPAPAAAVASPAAATPDAPTPAVVVGSRIGSAAPLRATTLAATSRTPPTLAAPVTATPVVAAPAATPVPASGIPPRTAFNPTDSRMLLTAAESCIALSRAAARIAKSDVGSPRADDAEDAEDADAEDAEDEYDDDENVVLVTELMRQPPFGAVAQPVPAAPVPARGARGMKRPRSVRCGKCDGCERDDCCVCKNCVDKPKFGGIGQRKQGCVRKLCRQPRVAA